jgi:hypothetical protein
MACYFIGYFPKKIERATEAMGLPGVSEIWSVSNCISSGPADWIQKWRHNSFGLFDTPELAASVVAPELIQEFQIVGYRLCSEVFGEGPRLPAAAGPATAMPSADFVVIGYDAVSCTQGHDFECSPLSCNGAAKQFAANERCLFAAADEALAAAAAFATNGWEPGPYYVVEVLARPNR